MSLSDTKRPDVLRAIRQFDRLGRNAFLEATGFAPSNRYLLVHSDAGGRPQRYDSKAIVGHALGLSHEQFSGGIQAVVRVLETLEFTVMQLQEDWTDDDLLLVLDAYLRRRPSHKVRTSDPEIRVLSDRIKALTEHQARGQSTRFRDPHEVAMQYEVFRKLHREGVDAQGRNVYPIHRALWRQYGENERARARRTGRLLDRLMPPRSIFKRSPEEVRSRVDDPEGPKRRSRRRRSTLTQPYQGPQNVTTRRPAKLRQEDPEKYDRSTRAHESVRDELAAFLERTGFVVQDSVPGAVEFDLGAVRDELALVMEVKSLPADQPSAEANRLRLGLGQVLWYRQRFWSIGQERRAAVLVVEREPRDADEWIRTCRSAGVVLTWPRIFDSLPSECLSVLERRW